MPGMQVILVLIFDILALVFIYWVLSGTLCAALGHTAFVPTIGKAKRLMLDEARRYLETFRGRAVVVDLGSGIGTLLIPLARAFPQHRFVGYEWIRLWCLISKIRAARLKNLTFRRQDFKTAHFSDAHLVLSYVGIGYAEKNLGDRLNRELPAGARVIAQSFRMRRLKCLRRIPLNRVGIPCFIFIYAVNRKGKQ
ncbi:MAG: hypothetical protein PHX68_00750 [Alphaproteobacteria bacterium]|nr:hypothetical protein [Alphaproteobacteria bacterium]